MSLSLYLDLSMTRAQIATSLAGRASYLPAGEETSLSAAARKEDVDATVDPDNDLVNEITIKGISTSAELATFLQNIPADIDSSLESLTFRK